MSKSIESITVISGNYPAPGRQVNVFVEQLVHALMDQGVKVTVVAAQSVVHALVHKEKLLPRKSKIVTDTGESYIVYRPYKLSFGSNKFFTRFTNWYNKRTLESLLDKIGVDILYSHFWGYALPVYEYASEHKLPLFVACGEGDNAMEDMVKSMPHFQLKKLADTVSGVISVSSENKRKCIQYNLCKPEDVDVFPNCVNTDIFHKSDETDLKQKLGIKEDDFVISFVGSFIPRKGPDRIAQAVTKLNDPKIKVIFIGKSFPGYKYDFDCPGIIHKGPLEHEMIPKYLNCSDVFVMPTQKEGCCNAIVEALAIGIPVISANRPFNDDILNDRNSIRVDPDDVEAITESIKILRDNKEMRQKMTDYSLSCNEKYTIQGRAKRILAFINKQVSKVL